MDEKIKIKEAIIVEGKYDKIKISRLFDTLIIATNGFDIYKNKSKLNLLKQVAEKNGVIILTDSDSAGFRIRNHIRNCLGDIPVKNAYIPEIEGKEKRKDTPSKEGFLGVEGVDDELGVLPFVTINAVGYLMASDIFLAKNLYEESRFWFSKFESVINQSVTSKRMRTLGFGRLI